MHGYGVGGKRNNIIVNDRVSNNCHGLFIRGYRVSDPGLSQIVHVGADAYQNKVVRGMFMHGVAMKRYQRTMLHVGLRCRGQRRYGHNFAPAIHGMRLGGMAYRGDHLKMLVVKLSSSRRMCGVDMRSSRFGGMTGKNGSVGNTRSIALGGLCVGNRLIGWRGS